MEGCGIHSHTRNRDMIYKTQVWNCVRRIGLLLQKANKTDGTRTCTLKYHCFPDEENEVTHPISAMDLTQWGHHQSQDYHPQQTHCWTLLITHPHQPHSRLSDYSPSVSLVRFGSETPRLPLPDQHRSHTTVIHGGRQKWRLSQSGIFSEWATALRIVLAATQSFTAASSVQAANQDNLLRGRAPHHSSSRLHFTEALAAPNQLPARIQRHYSISQGIYGSLRLAGP